MTGTIAKFIEKRWQARRDSNPQHPVLETGALPVRATGLQRGPIGKDFLVTAISDPRSLTPTAPTDAVPIESLDAPCGLGRHDRTS